MSDATARLESAMDFKPGDDLSYYLGPDAAHATEAQCEELRQALREAERAVGEIGGKGEAEHG